MSQQPPQGPPPGWIPPMQPSDQRPPQYVGPYQSPPPKRPGWWKRRSLLQKIGVVIGGLFGAFAVFVLLIAVFVPDTPAMKATKTAKAEARATGAVVTETAKEDRRTTSTAVAVAGKQSTQDAKTTSTAIMVAAKQSTQDTQANATANAPTSTPKPAPTEKPSATPKPTETPKPTATPLPSLNQVVSAKNWDIALTAVEKPGKTLAWSSYGNKTTASGTWLVVSLDATNTGRENFGLDYSDFTLYDGNGIKYNVTEDSGVRYGYTESRGGSNVGAQVPPGVTVHYYIVFDINPEAKGLRLEFSQLNFGGKKAFSLGI